MIDEEKKKWYIQRKAMETLDASLTGRPIQVKDALEYGELGFTSEGNTIFVASDHPYYRGMDENEVAAFRYGINVHEAMHQIFTDFNAFETALHRIGPVFEKHIFRDVFNVIEDPAIENFADQAVGGLALHSLYYMINTVYAKAEPLGEIAQPLAEYMNALIMFGDGGLIKGQFRSDTARHYFNLTAPIVYEAVNEPDGARRVELSYAVFQKIKPLWEGMYHDSALMAIRGAMESHGKSKAPNGKGSGRMPSPSTDGRNDRRKKEMEEQHAGEEEQLKKDAARGRLPGDGQEEEADGSSGENMQKNSPKTLSANQRAESENGEEKEGGRQSRIKDGKETGSPDGTAEDHAGTGNPGTQEDGNGDADQRPDSRDRTGEDRTDSMEPDTGEETMNENHSWERPEYRSSSTYQDSGAANEVTSETAVFPCMEGFIGKFTEMIEGFERGYDRDFPPVGAPVNDLKSQISETHRQFHGVREHNVYLEGSDQNREAYDTVMQTVSPIIAPVITQLKKIFFDDRGTRMYAQSGRISMRRVASGKVTTRVFEKKTLPGNKAEMCLFLLVDLSGSMSGEKGMAAKMTLITLCEIFAYFKIPVYCMGFQAIRGADAYQTHPVRWTNSISERMGILDLRPQGTNFDAYSIRYATELLKKRSEKHKLLCIVSDGSPSHYFSGVTGLNENKSAIDDARLLGINTFACGIGNISDSEFEFMYGKDYFIRIMDPSDMADRIAGLIKTVVKSW